MKGQSGKMYNDITIKDLVPKPKFIITPDYDDTLADQPRREANIKANATRHARNLVGVMTANGATAPYGQLNGRVSLGRTRSDELDTYVDAFKAEIESLLSNYLVVIVPYENVQPTVPTRDLTVYAWPRLHGGDIES